MTVTTLHDIIGESASILEEKGVDSPLLSAQVLACHALSLDRVGLITNRRRELSADELGTIRELVRRRATGEPTAYILGQREFFGLDFAVCPGILIPRPETEHIVEKVQELFGPCDRFRFADLGTGSGILAVTVAHLFQQAEGMALDLSPVAVACATQNAKRHGVDARLDIRPGDMCEPFAEPGSLDLVLSNPPYVTEAEYDQLDQEVAGFEPRTALVSGQDGLDHLRQLLPHAAAALRDGGHLLVEIGWRQGQAAQKITSEYGRDFGSVEILKDLSGHDRIIFATRTVCKKTTHQL
ncbi:peptide chain release factor N(5)-glutamine methyltransferase [Desulfovibrio oxyclinae]|uniref:peptide chain release factor N(5)-glutamine methyltransferase n=1 Tax=Desulfovibrio oxyclinae TaxID=63560 RepID=UPI00039AF10C|nr:peptide chain release factor N(5)-glutamine methyltransferase [Desulfovibrio oxyclinae]